MKRYALLIFASIFCLLGLAAYLQRWAEDLKVYAHLPPCLGLSPEKHHYFQAGCSGSFDFQGRSVHYEINEMGWRERPLSQMKTGQVMMLGDSMVEGWGMDRERALSSGLEKALAPSGVQFQNGGIRFSGPVLQSLRAFSAMDRLKPRFVLWFLAENDLFDDRFAYSIASERGPGGLPVAFSLRDFDAISWIERWSWLESVAPTVYKAVRYSLYQREVERLVDSVPVDSIDPCAALRGAQQEMRKRGVKVLYVALPIGPYGDVRRASHMDRLLSCVPPGQLIDYRSQLAKRTDLYFLNDTHLNFEGVKLVTEWLSPVLKERWGL